MPEDKLRVRRRGDAMVPNYEVPQVHGQPPRYHTHRHDLNLGTEFKFRADVNTRLAGQLGRAGAFVGHDEIIEVPDTAEYRRHLRDGDLWPADQATAQAVGRPFDSNFGEAKKVAMATSLAASPIQRVTEEH